MKNIFIDYPETMAIVKLLKVFIPDIQSENHAVATKFKEHFEAKITDTCFHIETETALDGKKCRFAKGILRILYKDDILAYLYKDSQSSRLVIVNHILDKYRNEITDLFSEFVNTQPMDFDMNTEDKIYRNLVKEFDYKENKI